MRHSIQRVAIAAAAGLLVATSAASAADEFTFAHGNSPTSSPGLAALEFKRFVEEASNGEMIINVHPSGELGKNQEAINGARQGTVDFTMVGNPWMTGFNPVQNVLDIPFIFEDNDHVYRVLDGDVGQALLTSFEEHNLKGLGWFEIGFRNVINSQRDVRTIDDLKGLKLRTTGNKAHIQAFELLGAAPEPMAFGEVYTALQTGRREGTEHPVDEIRAMSFHEVATHLSLTRHAYTAMPVIASLARWNSLSADQQKIISDGVRAATELQRAEAAATEASSLQIIKDAGVTVIEDIDTQPFREAVFDQVVASYVDTHGGDLVDAIIAAGE